MVGRALGGCLVVDSTREFNERLKLGGRLLPVLYFSKRHWLFGSRRSIETQDVPGLLANLEFDNSQSGGHMMVGSFLDHD